MKRSGALAIASYLGVLLLQPIWLALLPAPMGAANPVLALIASLALLLPLRGVLQLSLRALTCAGYLLMLYLVVGVMEAWSNPPQRIPALLQTFLVGLFVASTLTFSRRSSPDRSR